MFIVLHVQGLPFRSTKLDITVSGKCDCLPTCCAMHIDEVAMLWVNHSLEIAGLSEVFPGLIYKTRWFQPQR